MAACPVVVIATKNGPVEINESDFDPKLHQLYEQAAAQAAVEAPAPAPRKAAAKQKAAE